MDRVTFTKEDESGGYYKGGDNLRGRRDLKKWECRDPKVLRGRGVGRNIDCGLTKRWEGRRCDGRIDCGDCSIN